ncbi:uncharacterized protein LOC62_04G005341 [Vanrija pseudolonga]|uniref:Uncharacterized protein n=1 Tax=Vanrija pseudolonga TaxID=143232 RepID=A0AAF1BR80_9TREE|nr:hypothetical protein LOC62_04G005341 [Vanrija pseudolonga]
MPVVIDHNTYPHIIDLIVAAEPPSALLRLRGTSKTFNRRIDGLVAHAVLWSGNSSWVPGENPQQPWTNVVPLVGPSPSNRSLPSIRWAVKILDIKGNTPDPDPELSCFKGAHTVRRFGRGWEVRGRYGFPLAHTVVDFVHFSFDASPRGDVDVYTPRFPLQFIIHIKYDVSWFDLLADRRVNADSGPCDRPNHHNVTFVLWPYSPAGKTPQEGPLHFLHHAVWSFLKHYDGTTDISLTVVGVEKIATPQHRESAEDIFTAITSRGPPPSSTIVWGVYSWLLEPALVDTVKRALRLITLEEWWQELGDRKDLLGVWPENQSA